MSDFLNSSSNKGSNDQSSKQEALIDNVRSELALANAQKLMNDAAEACFSKCVPKPWTHLSGSEETCISRCLDRYMEAFNIVSRSYIARLNKERIDT